MTGSGPRRERAQEIQEEFVEPPRYEIEEAVPRNIPTAAGYNVPITLIVPEDMPCFFRNARSIFRRESDKLIENTVSCTVEDNEDGTVILNCIFDATPKCVLEITLEKDCGILQSGPPKSYINVG